MVCNILGQFLLKSTILYTQGNTEYKIALWKAWGIFMWSRSLQTWATEAVRLGNEEKCGFSKLLGFLISMVTDCHYTSRGTEVLGKQLKAVLDGEKAWIHRWRCKDTCFSLRCSKLPFRADLAHLTSLGQRQEEQTWLAISGEWGCREGVICEMGFLLAFILFLFLLSCDFSTSTVWLSLSAWFINCE